jgi:hypothetical protein
VVCASCGGWLSSCVVDKFRRAYRCRLLGFLVLFSLCEAGALPGCVPLVRSAKVAVHPRLVSLDGYVLIVVSIIALTGGGG